MITVRVGQSPAPTQAAQRGPGKVLSRDEHRQHAAWHLYDAVKPEGGLSWWQLTPNQQQRFLGLIDMAARCSDVTAIRAAHEAVAEILAGQNDESLRIIPHEMRGSYRAQALQLCLMFERVLTTGSPETDAKILSLVTEEAEAYARRTGGRPS